MVSTRRLKSCDNCVSKDLPSNRHPCRTCTSFQHWAPEDIRIPIVEGKVKSDGSTASYYELPEGATELQDIISAKNMNAQLGEIFRACMRYGQVEHSPKKRDIKKIIYYANEELKRLEKYESE